MINMVYYSKFTFGCNTMKITMTTIPLTNFEREKQTIAETRVVERHKVLWHFWLQRKKILDLIFKEQKSEDSLPDESVIVPKTELVKLGIEKRQIVRHILELTLMEVFCLPPQQRGILVSIRTHAYNVIDRDWIAFIIKDQKAFDEYHTATIELCDFIKRDGEKKFPLAYGRHPSSGSAGQLTREQQIAALKSMVDEAREHRVDAMLEDYEKNRKNSAAQKMRIECVKSTMIDTKTMLLEVRGKSGESVPVSFRSKRGVADDERENKTFRILYHLYDMARWELRGGREIKAEATMDYATLENLKIGAKCKSAEAAYKHIVRLNRRFAEEGVPITIRGDNRGKYRMFVTMC